MTGFGISLIVFFGSLHFFSRIILESAIVAVNVLFFWYVFSGVISATIIINVDKFSKFEKAVEKNIVLRIMFSHLFMRSWVAYIIIVAFIWASLQLYFHVLFSIFDLGLYNAIITLVASLFLRFLIKTKYIHYLILTTLSSFVIVSIVYAIFVGDLKYVYEGVVPLIVLLFYIFGIIKNGSVNNKDNKSGGFSDDHRKKIIESMKGNTKKY